MIDEAELAHEWKLLTTTLIDVARENLSTTAFLSQVLRTLKERFGFSRATYLRAAPSEETGAYVVTGESYPSGKIITPLEANLLNVFGKKIMLPEDVSRRAYEDSISREGIDYKGSVVQIELRESTELHTLCLTFNDSDTFTRRSLKEQEEIFNFLELLAHITNSKQLSEAQMLRGARTKATKAILSQTGSVSEVAQKVCSIWREWLNVPAVRLWAFNSEFQELDLLDACADSQHKKYFEHTSNRLSSASIGAMAISQGTVLRVRTPTTMREWDADPGLTDLMSVLPELICVPIISADKEPGSKKPRLLGLIDLHVQDVNSVKQPDSRLLFIGTVTAAALLRARSFERYETIKELNQIAIDLVNPKDIRRLSERKEDYLIKVKSVIKKAVNANCVSIFEADESRDIIRCVATTGIQGEKNFKKSVFYRANEGLTWDVFTTGKHRLLSNINNSQCPEYKGKFREERTLPLADNHDPLLIFPLPGQTPSAATGVIRIVERTCSVYPHRLQNFSDHDVDMIQLITHQVSPALQMIRMQAHRELFVERTAHQVTQPLQGVIAYTSNILDGIYDRDPEKRKKKFRYIRQMARAAAGMMRSAVWASGITDFSFLKKVHREEVGLCEYFIDRVIDLQPIREHDDVKVSFINSEEANTWGNFLVDEQFFDQVVQNLLHNAVKYSYPKTKVEIKVQRLSKELRVFISSTGVPLEASDPERIFGDRERGKLATRYDPQGTGQGLYIARQIMRGLGGDVVLLSTVEDNRVTPPPGFPRAQRNTFQIIYPEAFPK